jgi:hypothetical protein
MTGGCVQARAFDVARWLRTHSLNVATPEWSRARSGKQSAESYTLFARRVRRSYASEPMMTAMDADVSTERERHDEVKGLLLDVLEQFRIQPRHSRSLGKSGAL